MARYIWQVLGLIGLSIVAESIIAGSGKSMIPSWEILVDVSI